MDEKMDDQDVHTAPNHHSIQRWMFSQFFFFKSSLLLNGKFSIKVRPLTSSDDLCLPCCTVFILLPCLLLEEREENMFRCQKRQKDVFPKIIIHHVPAWPNGF